MGSVKLELLKTMLSPDDILADNDMADIKQAHDEFAQGGIFKETLLSKRRS